MRQAQSIPCSVAECQSLVWARGLCGKHLKRFHANGSPDLVCMIFGDPLARLAAHIDPVESGCWLWTGAPSSDGYGVFWDGTRGVPAHRAVYMLLKGPIPESLTLDHLCRTRLCVNPDHLEPVTNKENILRGESGPAQAARRDACARGHIYTAATLRVNKRWGYRECRVCDREKQARYVAARRV